MIVSSHGPKDHLSVREFRVYIGVGSFCHSRWSHIVALCPRASWGPDPQRAKKKKTMKAHTPKATTSLVSAATAPSLFQRSSHLRNRQAEH